MKKAFFFLLLLVFLAGGIFFLTKRYIGDPRTFLPANKNLAQIIEEKELEQQSAGESPEFPLTLPPDYTIGLFAERLGAVRDLAFSPKGVLIASVPSDGKIIALPDKNQDGRVDQVINLVRDLNKPHGVAIFNGKLFIAEETQVSRYSWDEENIAVTREKVLFSIPKGGRHFSRTLAFDNSGNMYVSIGSTCDVCREAQEFLAAVIVSDEHGKSPTLFASGLRNSPFIAVSPETQELWGTEMGRDFLGDGQPPDEINIIRKGENYGWPICYGNRIHDTQFDKNQYIQDPCINTQAPIYEIAAHSAPLGLIFIDSPQFAADWQGDLLVAYHGSWNRSTPIGYKVVRMKVTGNKITGEEDFLSGFLEGSEALGRPVDLAFDQFGSLYISDDKANAIYKVVKK